MNLPNTLTLLRIILTIIFIVLIFQSGFIPKLAAAIVFLAASLTDFLDGYYAKKHNVVTNFGKLMDPIADKFLMLAAFFIFTLMHLIPVWMFVVIFFREAAITVMRLAAILKGKVLAAERTGKYKTIFQIIAVSVILLYLILKETPLFSQCSSLALISWIWTINILMAIVVGLTVGSGIKYLVNARNV